jgi:shikimate kinase
MESGGSDPGREGREDGPSVLLVGFMAAGKSAVAEILARRLGWRVRDVDRILEEEEGHAVRDLFASRGEAWFRDREATVTARLLQEHRIVLAPGGGWAAVPGRLDDLPDHVLSVWLRVGVDTALRRAAEAPGSRPLLAAAGEADGPARAAVEALLRQREPRYRRAAVHLDTDGATPLEVADSIVNHLARRQAPDGRILE